MLSRMVFAAIGVGAGVAVGVWALRKVERTTRELAPDALAARAGRGASGLAERVAAALEVGRRAADAKEAELRATYIDRDGERDAVG